MKTFAYKRTLPSGVLTIQLGQSYTQNCHGADDDKPTIQHYSLIKSAQLSTN